MSKVSEGRSLRHVAMDYLARREHTAFELRNKLKGRAQDEDELDQVLAQLKAEKLQSDERFTEAFVNQRFRSGVGPVKIRYELRQKGVEDWLVDEFLEPLDGEWHEMMCSQRERKFGHAIPEDYSARMKQARFLQNRGFSPEAVMRLFR